MTLFLFEHILEVMPKVPSWLVGAFVTFFLSVFFIYAWQVDPDTWGPVSIWHMIAVIPFVVGIGAIIGLLLGKSKEVQREKNYSTEAGKSSETKRMNIKIPMIAACIPLLFLSFLYLSGLLSFYILCGVEVNWCYFFSDRLQFGYKFLIPIYSHFGPFEDFRILLVFVDVGIYFVMGLFVEYLFPLPRKH